MQWHIHFNIAPYCLPYCEMYSFLFSPKINVHVFNRPCYRTLQWTHQYVWGNEWHYWTTLHVHEGLMRLLLRHWFSRQNVNVFICLKCMHAMSRFEKAHSLLKTHWENYGCVLKPSSTFVCLLVQYAIRIEHEFALTLSIHLFLIYFSIILILLWIYRLRLTLCFQFFKVNTVTVLHRHWGFVLCVQVNGQEKKDTLWNDTLIT